MDGLKGALLVTDPVRPQPVASSNAQLTDWCAGGWGMARRALCLPPPLLLLLGGPAAATSCPGDSVWLLLRP